MADSCEACKTLKEESINTVRKGITETECNNLQNDKGLSGKHNDCTDLNTLNDCLIKGLEDEIELTDDCDWKKYAKAENANKYNVFKALICVICGLWKNIHDLWAEIAKIKEEIKNLWLNINNLWAAIRILQQEDIKIWDAIKALKNEDISIWTAINALIQSDITINNKIDNINKVIDVINRDVGNLKSEDTKLWNAINSIKNNLPGGFSTLVTKEIWRGVGHAGNDLKLSEPALNFDAIRVSFNVGGAQYSTDIQPGYLQHNAPNVATYSGIDFSGTNKLEGSAGLKATNATMNVLNVVPNKSNLVWVNLTNGNIEQFFQGTSCNNQVGECTISRIEGVRKINY